jgi:hypothetical protein
MYMTMPQLNAVNIANGTSAGGMGFGLPAGEIKDGSGWESGWRGARIRAKMEGDWEVAMGDG